MNRPCDRHDFQVDLVLLVMKCRNCPIQINTIGMENKREVIKAIQEAERDWYIKELES